MNLTHPKIKVGVSPSLKIRGILATEKIAKGELIENCPIILVPKKEWPALEKTVLWKYYYEWNNDNHAVVLGFGCLYNHSYTPNTKYVFDFKNKRMKFVALKEILEGEEVMVNYNFDPDSKEELEPHLVDFNEHHPHQT